MSVNCSLRIARFQLLDELFKRSPLRFGASVLRRFSVFGATPDVADADRASVLPCAMRSDLLNGSALVDRAVEIDNEVVADAAEVTLTMPAVDVGDSEGLALRGCCTMNDDLVNLPHGLVV